MSDALVTKNTTLSYGDGATPEVFTEVSEVTDLGGPDMESADVEVTHLKSTAKEFKPALPDPGQLSYEINYVPGSTTHEFIENDQDNQTVRNWQVGYPNGAKKTFAAYVRSFQPKSPVNGVHKANVALRVTGKPTRTPGP